MKSSNSTKALNPTNFKSQILIALLIGGLSIVLVNIVSVEASLLGLEGLLKDVC